jgi:SPP1 gp7 family putative phage head morphogenesis protein
LELKAEAKEMLLKEYKADAKKKDTVQLAKNLRKLFDDPTQREEYYKAVNRKLDEASKPFAKELEEYFSKQEDRVIAGFKEEASKGITKALPKKILDANKEAKLLAEISLPFLEEYFKDSGTQALAGLAPAEEFVISKARAEALQKRSALIGASVTSTTTDRLERVIADGLEQGLGNVEIANNIRALYAEIPVWRADMIARTEATNANNEGLIEGYKQSGIATHKEWVATLDDRTRDEHVALNGEVVRVDENFSNGEDYPNEVNCRCVIAPVFKED